MWICSGTALPASPPRVCLWTSQMMLISDIMATRLSGVHNLHQVKLQVLIQSRRAIAHIWGLCLQAWCYFCFRLSLKQRSPVWVANYAIEYILSSQVYCYKHSTFPTKLGFLGLFSGPNPISPFGPPQETKTHHHSLAASVSGACIGSRIAVACHGDASRCHRGSAEAQKSKFSGEVECL